MVVSSIESLELRSLLSLQAPLPSFASVRPYQGLDLRPYHKPSRFIVLANGGFGSDIGGVGGDEMRQVLTKFPGFVQLLMFHGRPYSFAIFQNPEDAIVAFEKLDSKPCEGVVSRKVLLLAYVSPLVIERYLSGTRETVLSDPILVSSNIPGLTLVKEFIDEVEVSKILLQLKKENNWITLRERRVVEREGLDEPFPEFFNFVLEKYDALGLVSSNFDQLTVNDYSPGCGIAPHTDTHSSFIGPILIVSLGSDIVMEFRKRLSVQSDEVQNYVSFNVLLPKNSLIVMNSEVKLGWEHGIRARRFDIVEGLLKERGKRFSLTIRTVRAKNNPCNCEWTSICDKTLTQINNS
ncbi:Alkylated DNA repair protein alkB 8 [Nowakowskiella sp. JEL0078]|nr:Alkylated DNA repair protein alkB 8 [Nowakowskiella sp. JEL0078]